MADDVLRQGVQGISDLVTMTGLINLDFADVKAVMENAGTALMAVGEARGEGRAVAAAQAAISSPLLDMSIEGATGVLINITGGPGPDAARGDRGRRDDPEAVDPDANIIFGAVVHPRLQDEVRVTVIATGLQRRRPGHDGEPTLRRATASRKRRPRRPEPSRARGAPSPSRGRATPTPSRGPAPAESASSQSPELDRVGSPRTPPPPGVGARPLATEPPGARRPPAGDDDAWATPPFLRRPRR